VNAGGGAVAIRTMVEGDLDRVLAIADSLSTAPRWPREAYAAAIGADGWPRRIALVAEVGGEVAGFAVARLVAEEAELESIVVPGELQGRGIGWALLSELIRLARLAGAREIGLELRESNRTAGRLYERAGFREAGRRLGYYREPVENAVVLRLALKA